MCDACTALVRKALKEGRQFQQNDRKVMTVEKVDGDEVYLKDHKPKPAFHVSHAGALVHWLHGDHFICGIGSGTTAIKTLVARGGKLDVNCARCAGQASQLWAVLATLPGIRRDQLSGLAPDPSTRPDN